MRERVTPSRRAASPGVRTAGPARSLQSHTSSSNLADELGSPLSDSRSRPWLVSWLRRVCARAPEDAATELPEQRYCRAVLIHGCAPP